MPSAGMEGDKRSSVENPNRTVYQRGPLKKEDITLERFKKALLKNGYILNTEGITTGGIRVNDLTINLFNDFLFIYHISGGVEILTVDNGTVDPGTYWMQHPMNVNGTAVMKFGHYHEAYSKGHHKEYDALVQVKPIDFYRITKKQFDSDNVGIPAGQWKINLKDKKIVHELIGANQHRANPNAISTEINMWSAGCQVRCNPAQYNSFISTTYKSTQKFYDYILLSENDLF